jgi:hypothetical protein
VISGFDFAATQTSQEFVEIAFKLLDSRLREKNAQPNIDLVTHVDKNEQHKKKKTTVKQFLWYAIFFSPPV